LTDIWWKKNKLDLTKLIYLFRCATGEAWPDIMLDAGSGRPCDAAALVYNKTTGNLQTVNSFPSERENHKV
jgi:hypothetical protein